MLWLKNNSSTLTSQFADSLAVVLITYFFTHVVVPGEYHVSKYLIIKIASNYVFKMVAALPDTIPFYFGVRFLSKYLDIDLISEYRKVTIVKGL